MKEPVPQRPVLSSERFPCDRSSLARTARRHPAADSVLHPEICQENEPRHREIPSATLEALTNYDWPGNIRELQNVIERSVILSNGPELHVALPELSCKPAAVRSGYPAFGCFGGRRARANPAGVGGSQGTGRRGERRSLAARPEADDLAIPHAEIQYRPPVSVSDRRRVTPHIATETGGATVPAPRVPPYR